VILEMRDNLVSQIDRTRGPFAQTDVLPGSDGTRRGEGVNSSRSEFTFVLRRRGGVF
jgi:hypothetical protein